MTGNFFYNRYEIISEYNLIRHVFSVINNLFIIDIISSVNTV